MHDFINTIANFWSGSADYVISLPKTLKVWGAALWSPIRLVLTNSECERSIGCVACCWLWVSASLIISSIAQASFSPCLEIWPPRITQQMVDQFYPFKYCTMLIFMLHSMFLDFMHRKHETVWCQQLCMKIDQTHGDLPKDYQRSNWIIKTWITNFFTFT